MDEDKDAAVPHLAEDDEEGAQRGAEGGDAVERTRRAVQRGAAYEGQARPGWAVGVGGIAEVRG